MIIDEGVPRRRSAGPSNRAKKFKEEIQRNRQERRENIARRAERLATQEDEVLFDFTGDVPQPTGSPPQDPAGKRKGSASSSRYLHGVFMVSYICSKLVVRLVTTN